MYLIYSLIPKYIKNYKIKIYLHFRDNQILGMEMDHHIGCWCLVFGKMVGILFLGILVFLVDLLEPQSC